jgi:hypothetical protein
MDVFSYSDDYKVATVDESDEGKSEIGRGR